MVKKARLTKVVFNPRWPVLLVGDDKGCVTSLKLSPNLRRRAVPEKGAKVGAARGGVCGVVGCRLPGQESCRQFGMQGVPHAHRARPLSTPNMQATLLQIAWGTHGITRYLCTSLI